MTASTSHEAGAGGMPRGLVIAGMVCGVFGLLAWAFDLWLFRVAPLQDWMACGSLISITERAAAYEEWARTRLADFGERMRSRLMLGAFVSGVDYLQAVRRRRDLGMNA